jgi:hypothetical protein
MLYARMLLTANMSIVQKTAGTLLKSRLKITGINLKSFKFVNDLPTKNNRHTY